MRAFWAVSGSFFLLCGLIGVVLPLLPTVPFLLLATFCFARSSERMHTWLVTHRVFGPMIADWQRSGAIRPAAKRAATASVVLVFCISLALRVSPTALGIQALVLCCVLTFIWTRPDA